MKLLILLSLLCLVGAEKCGGDLVTYSWEDYECTSKNDGEYLIKSTKRRCVGSDGSIGTTADCLYYKNATSIYWKSQEEANWTTARDHCKELGGKLFDGVSISLSVIIDICERHGDFWTNIWSPANSGQWKNYESGEVAIPEKDIDWQDGQPDDDETRDRAILFNCFDSTWEDWHTSTEHLYVCIM